MENASKALLLAGGILLAIIILSFLVYMMTSLNSISRTQDEQAHLDEIVAFNKEYESYNKKRLYGAEVISVMNKAIENNEKYNSSIVTDPYYINIRLTTKQDFETTVKVINNEKKEVEITNQLEKENIIKDLIPSLTVIKPDLEKNTYELGTNGQNADIVNFFSLEPNDTWKYQDGDDHYLKKGYTYYVYSGLTTFKRLIFECTDVVYNDEGRVCKMTFEQK